MNILPYKLDTTKDQLTSRAGLLTVAQVDEKGIRYAIRAKMSPMIRSQIDAVTEEDWMPLLDKQGKSVKQDQPIKTHITARYIASVITMRPLP